MGTASIRRKQAPVFIVGSPRSGTTLVYHTLLSSTKFVIYQAESDIFNRIAPAFGDLRSVANRRKLADAWLQSDYFRRTGLNAESVRADILCRCRNPGDLLKTVMDRMAETQGVVRWADNTPAHVLYLSAIKACIPDALFIHVIRDGRDVAMSMNQMGWGWGGGYRIPWDHSHGLLISALHWQWLVRRGREQGKEMGSDYCEIHYEDLLQRPKETIATISSFIGDELCLEQIESNAMGTLVIPNSSFGELQHKRNSYIGRWKKLDALTAERLNFLIGPFLKELGYKEIGSAKCDLTTRRLSAFYPLYHRVRHRVQHSPVGKWLICKDRLRPGALDAALWKAFSIPRAADKGFPKSESATLAGPASKNVAIQTADET